MSDRDSTTRDEVFHEVKNSKTYKRTKAKFGRTVANKQLVAESLHKLGKGKKRPQRKRM